MSDSLIPISDAQAELVTEGIRTISGIGSFLAKALGSTPEDLIGYLGGDYLRIRHAENIARLIGEARERLGSRGVAEPTPASLSVALPILRSAADEDREELVDLWARLLASAMDPARNRLVRQSYIEAVKKMDPPDVLVLAFMHEHQLTSISVGYRQLQNHSLGHDNMAQMLGKSADEILISLQNLANIGFLDYSNLTIYYPAPTCREFLRACYP